MTQHTAVLVRSCAGVNTNHVLVVRKLGQNQKKNDSEFLSEDQQSIQGVSRVCFYTRSRKVSARRDRYKGWEWCTGRGGKARHSGTHP